MILRRRAQKRKGQALVEYAILICGVAMISLVSVSLLGHKTAEMIGTLAVILPSPDPDENAPIQVGKLVETTTNSAGAIGLDVATIKANSGTDRLGKNLGANLQIGDNLIVDGN